MQIPKIQNYNYNPQFQGFIKIQSLKKGGEVKEIETTFELDRGLAKTALKNLFEGSWTNSGDRSVPGSKLALYAEALKQTLGINLPRTGKAVEHVKLTHLDNGYSIESGKNYKLTHIREDIGIWDLT